MTEAVRVSGSLRNRLATTLIGGAAVLAILLFFVVRSYAAQIAQQGQDSILGASVTSILDAASVRDGRIEVDFPYASFSMLGTDSDDRIFMRSIKMINFYRAMTGCLPWTQTLEATAVTAPLNFKAPPSGLPRQHAC